MNAPRPMRLVANVAVVVLLAAGCTGGSNQPAPPGPSTVPSSSTTTTTTIVPPGNTASAPGVTPVQITIGTHQPLSGPNSVGVAEVAPAANAYFQYVNDHGGVHGRRIVLTALDDESDPATAASEVRRLVLDDQVFAIFDGFGTAADLAARGVLAGQRVPDLFVGSGCTCVEDLKAAPYTFGFQPDDTTEGMILGQYITQHLAGHPVGYLVPSGPDAAGFAAGLDRQVTASSVVSRETYAATGADLTDHVGALQRAGAQVVVLSSQATLTALALLAAAAADYHPIWVVAGAGADVTTVTGQIQTLSKGDAGGSLFEGVITDAYLAPVADSTNPWTALWRKVRDAYAPKLSLDANVAHGMAAAYTFVQALFAAGQNPTRSGIVHAAETSLARGVPVGPGLVPFGYSASSHRGYLGVQIGTIAIGRFAPIGPAETVTDAGVIQPVTAPPANPPPSGVPSAP
ncbi:MAG: ABC transporter substrate-binding protein [Acidimicrobiales bacterium]